MSCSFIPRVLSVGAILAFIAVLQAARADSKSEDLLLSNARTASETASSNLPTLEAKALSDSDARRQGDRLVLRLRSGKTKGYRDLPECRVPEKEARCSQYNLIVHARTRGVFILAKRNYESLDIILVDDGTGEETILSAFPIFSPSGKQLVVLIENDPALSFLIQIWRRDGGRFVEAWSGAPNSEGSYVSYKLLNWSSEDVIDVQSQTSYDSSEQDVLRRFSLRNNNGNWTVVPAP